MGSCLFASSIPLGFLLQYNKLAKNWKAVNLNDLNIILHQHNCLAEIDLKTKITFKMKFCDLAIVINHFRRLVFTSSLTQKLTSIYGHGVITSVFKAIGHPTRNMHPWLHSVISLLKLVTFAQWSLEMSSYDLGPGHQLSPSSRDC